MGAIISFPPVVASRASDCPKNFEKKSALLATRSPTSPEASAEILGSYESIGPKRGTDGRSGRAGSLESGARSGTSGNNGCRCGTAGGESSVVRLRSRIRGDRAPASSPRRRKQRRDPVQLRNEAPRPPVRRGASRSSHTASAISPRFRVRMSEHCGPRGQRSLDALILCRDRPRPGLSAETTEFRHLWLHRNFSITSG